MAKPAKTLRLRPVFVVACGAALLSALVVVMRPWEERVLARLVRAELATLSDEAAGDAIRRLALIGDNAIPLLVEALGSDRASVAEAARSVLLEEIDRWELLTARQSSPKLALVARSLAAEVERFGPSSRGLAANLAERILLWPTDTNVIDQAGLIGHCAEVLRRTAPDRRRADRQRVAAVEQSFLLLAESDRFAQAASRQDASAADESNVLAMARLPGGGLPIEPAGVPALPPRTLVAERPDDGATETSPTAEDAAAELAPPDRLPIFNSARPATEGRNRGFAGDPLPSIDARQPHVARKLPGGEFADELQDLAPVDLMRLLHDTTAPLAEAAEAELVYRGYSNVEVELGRRLTDADPLVRRALVDMLPRVPRLNAKPWLLWLSDDPAADVRRAALTLMATSNDLDLLRRVEDLARRDPDPKIAELADRLLESRRRSPRR